MTDSDSSFVDSQTRAPRCWPFVLPLAVYLLIGTFEPRGEDSRVDSVASASADVDAQPSSNPNAPDSLRTSRFVTLTVAKFLAVGGCLIFFFPVYLRCFRFETDRWAWLAGFVGALIWIGLCSLALEPKIIAGLGFGIGGWSARSHFNPFLQIDTSIQRTIFLAARLGLLVLIVPVAEEMFLRGFLMRFVQSNQWAQVSLRSLSWTALASGSLYGVLTHPNEAIAALLWFSLISWLMVRTNRIWNCVLAHAVTNGLLGLYVVCFGQWQYW